MTEIYVKVKPDEENFSIEKENFLTFRLENPAENGKANIELSRRLEKILETDVGIVSGHKSRRKKIAVDLDENEINQKLEAYING